MYLLHQNTKLSNIFLPPKSSESILNLKFVSQVPKNRIWIKQHLNTLTAILFLDSKAQRLEIEWISYYMSLQMRFIIAIALELLGK
uniref:Ferritin n=1 Tax=Rhizophora mucronata TaxID=61149 RepID=A0A2P2KC12_RHIMU